MIKMLCRVLCLLLVLLVSCSAALAEPVSLSSPKGAEDFVRVLLGADPASLDGAYRLTDEMAAAVQAAGGFAGLAGQLAPLGKLQEMFPARADTLRGLRVYRVPCRFAALAVDIVLTLDGEALAGLITDRFTGDVRPETADAAYTALDLALPVPELNGSLPGTLTLPRGEGPFPAVVLIPGSGPCDRDGTLGALAPLRDIAEGLAERGIAAYRFDKRTLVYARETAADRQFTLVEEYVDDAAAAVQLLAARAEIDPERIFVLGHSLGGTAIPAIDRALRTEAVPARGYILMAPGARRLDALMREQYAFLAGIQPEIAAQRDALLAELDRLNDPDSLTENDWIAGAWGPYWQWLAAYDAPEAAKEISRPCLLLQGEEDYQVTMADYHLFREAVGGRENWTFLSYPGLTHTFTPGKKEDGPAVYAAPAKMDAAVLTDLAAFIRAE